MLNLVANGPSGYNLTNSLRFRSSASAYLNQTLSSSNRQTMTWSGWVKIGALSTDRTLFGFSNGTSTAFGQLVLTSANTLDFISYNSAVDARLTTTQVFRDPSAWYHIVAVWDTTNATSTNRLKLYINGSQVTSFSASTYPAQNYNAIWNNGYVGRIGAIAAASLGNYYDGYLAEVNFVDGQALTPSSFGSTNATTGVWQPAKYTGTYGTNGFYLKFSDIATTSGSNTGLGKDNSGNGNYWNTNNISVTAGTTYDAMTDVPTNTSATVANYAVWNPLDNFNSLTISNGNMTAARATTASWASSRATISMPSGKWYWEVTSGGGTTQVGILRTDVALTADSAANAYGYIYNANDGYRYNNGNSFAYGAAYNTAGDVVGVAWDADTGTLTFYKNGTSQGTAWSGLSGTYSPVISIYGTITTNVNFGQRSFAYIPPTGYVRLNTYNLPTPTILQGNKYMDATLYTGNGSSQSVTNAGSMKPDLVWLKSRSNAYSNYLVDSVRGASLYLRSNATNAEATNASVSFLTNGFGVNSATDTEATNQNAATYVGWQWQAGQGTNTTNTSGNVTSTVSVNATAGFSIVTYTVTSTASMTIGHGLGAVPKMIMEKTRGSAANWDVYHVSTGNTGRMILNSTSAFDTQAGVWNNTTPTSTVFSQQGNGGWHAVGTTCVAYCWAEIAGFSKFGSYTGNGSADGPFVYTGFRPKFILWKNSSSGTSYWRIFDTSRDTYNAANKGLYPNDSQAEDTTTGPFDFLSNGFKVRTSGAGDNGSGNTIIYASFAENPTKFALAR